MRMTQLSTLPTLFSVFVLGLLAVSGCKEDYPACKKDKHCKQEDGEKSVDGQCQNCVTDEDCKGKGEQGEDWFCNEFRCTETPPVNQSGPGSEGSPCTGDEVCNEGLVCLDGMCSKCTEDSQCLEGSCDLNTGLCSAGGSAGQCSVDDDCAMDEICDSGSCVFAGDYGNEGEVLCGLEAVYFGFDSPKLDAEVQAKLQEAASCIVEQDRLVYLESHADPRGTEEYNILLTDKRGNSVKGFLINLGVSTEKMQVISKGSLEAQGSDDASFSKDRRVEFIWQ